MRGWHRLIQVWVLVLVLVFIPLAGPGAQSQQVDPALIKARNLLPKLTVEERVGQLFLVTFQGSATDERSQVYDLIARQHVGGLVILRENENITNQENIPAGVYQLTSNLQQIKWQASQQPAVLPASGITFTPQYVPLFIAIPQEGDASPSNQILSGVTELPSLMAIGATWEPELARQTGQIMGQDLASLGFNMIFGPSLNIASSPQVTGDPTLGVRSFGGSPYWVSKMGQAYVQGLHEGSNDRLLVVASNFPGRGNADRPADEEIATVRSSLSELKSNELQPFFAVTGNASSPLSVVDGLMVSHVRYQGLQGNIRSSTRPISADPSALDQVFKLPEMASWRQDNRLVISDDLGSPAVRRFYEANGGIFNAQQALQVVREAFNAGNDLVYINKLVSADDLNAYNTLLRTLQFFSQKYRTDAEFARRVDASVERILAAKFRLYPEFEIEQVVAPGPDQGQPQRREAAEQVVMDVARQAVTLISPEANDLANLLPQPPGLRSRMVFLTDVQEMAQCAACNFQSPLKIDSLQNAVLRFYGPRATGQVSHSLMVSYSFSDVWKTLNGTIPEESATLENDLRLAEWIVVALTRPDQTLPETQAFRRLLSERPDLLNEKKVIVFAFDAPYYLDATDISKITAYYGVYSKISPFVDVAARVLFQELSPTGSLPVSVAGVGYDLREAIAPDPGQNIPLLIDPSPEVDLGTLTPTQISTSEVTPSIQTYGVDDVIPVRTGIILDRNGNMVPDNTRVNFQINVVTSSGRFNQQIEQYTTDGVARMTYRIEMAGVIDIFAVSGGAKSDILQLDIRSGESVPTIVMQPTETPQPTATPTPSITPTVTVTITPTVTPTPVPEVNVGGRDWLLMLALTITISAGISWLGIRQMVARWGLRWGLLGLIGGLLAYNYLALNLPGTQDFLRHFGTRGVVMVTLLGVCSGILIGLIWKFAASLLPNQETERRSTTSPKTGPKNGPKTGPKA